MMNEETREQEQTQEQQKFEPIHIKHMEMVGASKTAFTTSRALGNSIISSLNEVSDDIVSCTIYTKPKVGIMANLILSDNEQTDPRKCKLVTPFREEVRHMSTLDRLTQRQNQIRKYISLTDEGKFKLKDFIPYSFMGSNGRPIYPIDFKTKAVNWSLVTKEFPDRTNPYSEPRVRLAVLFDVTKWFKKIYGTKGPNGEHLAYIVSPIRPEQGGRYNYIGQTATSYVLSYTQLNEEELKRNCIVTSGDVPDFNPSFCAF